MRTLLLAAMALLATLGAGPTPTPMPLTTVSFVLPGQLGAVATVFYYGVEQGIFKKHGIDLKISAPTNASSTTNVNYVVKGQYDIGEVGGPQAMLYKQQYGGDLVIFYGYIQVNPKCVLVGQNTKIKSVRDLKGKTIAAPSNSSYDDLISFLQNEGLGPNDYTIVPLSNSGANAAYISGKVDGLNSYDENVPIFVDAGKPSRAFCERFGGVNYQQNDMATTRSFINAHRDVVAAFAAALTESIQAAKANPTAASGAVYRANPAQLPLGANVPAQMFAVVLNQYYSTANDKGHGYGWMSAKDWADTQSAAVNFFGLKPGLDFSSGWTNEFVR